MLAGVLSFDAVGKRYGRVDVLRGVTLTVAAGEVVAVSGRNGCGKSTLLRIAAGLAAPSSGRVSARPSRWAIVPDRFSPPERMTALSYLRHHGRMRGLDPRSAGQRAELLAERLGVLPGLEAELARLSQGNARKVQIAQAFLAPVDLVLLDEAVGALDEEGTVTVDQLVEEAAARGAAVLRTDPDAVPTRATRRLTLAGGVLEHDRSAS
jgi:ABC-type multidrug transport system ATPase subunit